MAWDNVPWFVGGGAIHSPEVARLLSFAAFGGFEGIIGAGDLKVTQLGTPGAGVQVAPGVAVILNGSTGGEYQAYAGRLVTADTVTVAATGGSARSDMIVARVEDPFLAGEPWSDPPDVTVGPYIFTRVISGVASNATVPPPSAGNSVIPLARIDIPAGTSAITNAMITDLRFLARPPQVQRNLFTWPIGTLSTLSSSSFVEFPNGAHTGITIPPWATKVRVRADWGSIVVPEGDAHGEIRVALGSLVTEATVFDVTVPAGTFQDRKFWWAADEIDIPLANRGTNVILSLEARKISGTVNPSADTFSTAVIDIEFIESIEGTS